MPGASRTGSVSAFRRPHALVELARAVFRSAGQCVSQESPPDIADAARTCLGGLRNSSGWLKLVLVHLGIFERLASRRRKTVIGNTFSNAGFSVISQNATALAFRSQHEKNGMVSADAPEPRKFYAHNIDYDKSVRGRF
jgi:hypothetical protein